MDAAQRGSAAKSQEWRIPLSKTNFEKHSTAALKVGFQNASTGEPNSQSEFANALLELPFFPSSPDAGEAESGEEAEEDPIQAIDTWIDSRVQNGDANGEEQAVKALRFTSMDPNLADVVLKYLKAGKDVPNNIRGVWTKEDDECIEAADTRMVTLVLEKHGQENFNNRWAYLELERAAGLRPATDAV